MSYAYAFRLLLRAIISSALVAAASPAFAVVSGVTYQGRILKPDGSALEGSNVQFRMQIRSPGGENCLLYEEQQNLDMRNTKGLFSLTLNDGSGARLDSSGLTIDRIFANRGALNFAAGACAVGATYTPNEGDGRKLVVEFKDETMGAWEPMPPTNINFVPFALETRQVQGFGSASLVRVQESDGTMGNVSPLSNAAYTELLALIAGSSTQYVRNSSTAGARVPTYAGNPSSVVAGSIWFDTSSNQLKFRDTSGVQTVGTASGSVTSVTAGSGLATTPAGGITSTGSIAIAVGGVVSTMLADGSVITAKIADGAVTDVKLADGAVITAKIANSAVTTAKLSDSSVTSAKIVDATIATADLADGSVTSAKIFDGTIVGGDLASNIVISTTGGITASGFTTSGTVTANAVTATTVSSGVNITRQIQLFDPDALSTNKVTFTADSTLSSDYTLTWPLDDGSANQLLMTDGTGKLSWTTITPGSGDFKADGTVPMTGNFRLGSQWLSNDGGSEGIRIDNSGYVGIGAAVPGSALHVGAHAGGVTHVQFDKDSNASGGSFILNDVRSGAGRYYDLYFRTQGTNRATLTAGEEAAGDAYFKIGVGASSTERLRIDSIGRVGIGTATPEELLDVAGAIRVGTTTTCGAPNPGTIRYNSGNLEYCNGTAWQILGVAGAGITALTGDVTASGTGSVAATIAADAVTSTKIADGTIATADVADSAITSVKVADGTIATADVADKAVTFAKVQDIATNKIVGRSTASSGPIEEISIGTGLSLSGGTLSSSVTGLPACADGQLALYVSTAWTCVGATAAGTPDTVVRRDSSGNFVAASATLTSSLVLKDGAAGGGVTIATPVGFSNYSLTLPTDDGTSGQVLATNGSGVLSWTTPATGSGDFKADGTVPMTGNLQLNNNWLSNDGGAEGIRVDNAGQVGVGTATPTVALDVTGSIKATGDVSVTNGSASAASPKLFGISTTSSGRYGRFTFESNNAAGIQGGYAQKFQIYSWHGIELSGGQGAAGPSFSAGSAGADTNVLIINRGSSTGATLAVQAGASQTANLQEWRNSAGTALNVVKPSGLVGIGTTDPKESLDVAGAIRVGTTTTCGAPNPGTIRYNSGNLEYCNGTAWQVLGLANSAITALTGDVTATGPGSVAATIAANAVTSAKIADGTIATADVADSAITSVKVADGTIATADVADKAVTFAKVQDIATNKLIGRSTASSGPMEELSVGTGLSLSGGTLSSTLTGLPSCLDGQLAIYVTSAWTCVGVGSTNVASTVVRRDGSGNFIAGSATLTSSLVLRDGGAGGQVSIATPVGFTSYALTLPVDDGTPGQVLTTNGSGALSWVTAGGDFKADGSVPMTGNIRLNDKWLSNDGGNEGIRIDNAGKVGIGTATPSGLFDVAGGTAASGNGLSINLTAQTGGASSAGGNVNITAGNAGSGTYDTGNIVLTAGSASNPGGKLTLGGSTWLGGHTVLQSSDGESNGVPGNLTLTTGFSPNNGSGRVNITTGTGWNGTTGSVYIYPGPNGAFAGGNVILGSDGTTARGKVGIGTGSPSVALDVAGQSNVSSSITSGNILTATNTNTTAVATIGVYGSSSTTGLGTVGVKGVVSSGGYVTGVAGHATSTAAGSYATGVAGQTDGGTGTGVSGYSSYQWGGYTAKGGSFEANGPDSYGLYARNNANSGNAIAIYATSPNTANGYAIYAPAGRNYFEGSVGIGLAAPSEKLEVSGNVKATSFITTSDARLKEDIAQVPGLEAILKIKGVRWAWKETHKPDMGVLAQDVEKVFPDAVVTDPKTGFKAVKYQALIAPLIESTKELYGMCKENDERIAQQELYTRAHDRRIASLESENKVLKSDNEKLKGEVDDLKRRMEQIEKLLSKPK